MREIDERFGPLDAEWLGWLWALCCAFFTQLPREAVRIVLTEMRMGWACDRCESVCGSVSVAVNRESSEAMSRVAVGVSACVSGPIA